jgi:hypothetical protein
MNMKNSMTKVRMECRNGTWAFVDSDNNKVDFDQAIVDATYIGKYTVEGFVVSVHGVDQEIAQYLDSKTRQELGIKAVHSLGAGPTLRRVRLMQGGEIERV